MPNIDPDLDPSTYYRTSPGPGCWYVELALETQSGEIVRTRSRPMQYAEAYRKLTEYQALGIEGRLIEESTPDTMPVIP